MNSRMNRERAMRLAAIAKQCFESWDHPMAQKSVEELADVIQRLADNVIAGVPWAASGGFLVLRCELSPENIRVCICLLDIESEWELPEIAFAGVREELEAQ